MRLFLPDEIWKNKRGFLFGKPVDYLKVGWHTGQDFFTNPVGSTPIVAPCDGNLTTFPFSKSAGWWGYYEFRHGDEIFSLKIVHMYKEMENKEYREGEILGYCGATGLSVTSKYGVSYIGHSYDEQISDRAVGHLHVELHKGEFKHDTNRVNLLAKQRIIDPVSTFEEWIKEETTIEQARSKKLIFYKEKGRSSIYIKGVDSIYYPIITGKHFLALFGDWKDNTIKEVDELSPKSDSYFGLFKSDNSGKYDTM